MNTKAQATEEEAPGITTEGRRDYDEIVAKLRHYGKAKLDGVGEGYTIKDAAEEIDAAQEGTDEEVWEALMEVSGSEVISEEILEWMRPGAERPSDQ